MGNRIGFILSMGIFYILTLMTAPPVSAGEIDAIKAQMQELIKQNRNLAEQNRRLSNRLQQLERQMSDMKRQMSSSMVGEGKKLIEAQTAEQEHPWYKGITIEGGVTGVVQATANNAHNNPEGGNKADAAYTMDLDLHADLDEYGTFIIHLEGGDGEGLNNNVPSFSVPNYDAYATWNNENQADLTISEAFYEKGFFNDMFSLDVGKMDISVLFDENEAAGDETTQFLSNIFVKSMGLTIPEPEEFYCPAMMLDIFPAKSVEFRIIGASVDNEDEHTWEDIFSNDFVAAQINLKPSLLNRRGNYRFYGWYDSRRHLDNDRLSEANINPSQNYSRADAGQGGWGISFDQEIAHGFTAFARYSWTQNDLSVWDSDAEEWSMIPFNQVYSLGMDINGMLWNRPDDGIGIAFGQTLLTKDFEKEQRRQGNKTADEIYFETWYRYAFNSHLAISADLQWIGNPGGMDEADDLFIFGLRSQIDF